MPDVQRKCWLYFAHWQQYVQATLCSLPAELVASVLVQQQIPFLVVAVVVEVRGPEILRCWEWVSDFV